MHARARQNPEPIGYKALSMRVKVIDTDNVACFFMSHCCTLFIRSIDVMDDALHQLQHVFFVEIKGLNHRLNSRQI